MFCPRCAEPNADGAKFCRACGEDLSVIAQAMARRLPVTLLSKMDAYLERKNERLRRDSIVGAVGGAAFLFISLYHLIVQREGFSFNVVFLFLMACFMFLWSAWDFLVFKRSLAHHDAAEQLPRAAAAQTRELEQRERRDAALPPQSVAEQTTRYFDAVPRQKGTKE